MADPLPGFRNYGKVSSPSGPEKLRSQFLSLHHMTLILLFKAPAKREFTKRPKAGG
jgi:hypothetical protein